MHELFPDWLQVAQFDIATLQETQVFELITNIKLELHYVQVVGEEELY